MTDISEKILHEIYKEDVSRLIGNFDKREALTSIIPVEYSGKLEKFLFSADTEKVSVEKLQEQLNTAKKALTEISKTKVFYRSRRDHWEEFSQDALKAQKALAAIEKGENNEI